MAMLPADMKVDERTQQRQDNRRKFLATRSLFRWSCATSASIPALRVNATDISGNGCYVETVMPLPVATALRMDFWIDEERFSAHRRRAHARSWRRDGNRVYRICPTNRRNDSRRISTSWTLEVLSAPRATNRLRIPIWLGARHSCKICNHYTFQPSNDRTRRRPLAHEDRDHVLSDIRRQWSRSHGTGPGTGAAWPRNPFHFVRPADPACEARSQTSTTTKSKSRVTRCSTIHHTTWR